MEFVKVATQDRIATVTIDRPDALNALSAQVIGELDETFRAIAADADVGVAILTGAGPKAFVAGADITELLDRDTESGRETAAFGQRMMRHIETMGKPSIAAINGFALGGGCELAMSCSIRIAAENARFGQPEVNLGVIPGYAGTQRLPRLVGKGVAMDLILTGRMIDAAEALRLGLVTQVVAPDELMEAATKTAQTLLSKGPLALRAAMHTIDKGFDMTLDEASALEVDQFAELCSTEDMKEGLRAFLEKRAAEFKGR